MSSSSISHLPDAFEIAMSGRSSNGHNLSPIQKKEEPYQMVLSHPSAESGIQLPIFGDEYTGQLSLPLDDNKENEG